MDICFEMYFCPGCLHTQFCLVITVFEVTPVTERVAAAVELTDDRSEAANEREVLCISDLSLLISIHPNKFSERGAA